MSAFEFTVELSPYVEIDKKVNAWKLDTAVLNAPNTGSSLPQSLENANKTNHFAPAPVTSETFTTRRFILNVLFPRREAA